MMNFIELKELAKKLGGIVVMNGSTPELVILSYENYKKLENPATPAGPPAGRAGRLAEGENTGEIEKLNQEILGLKEEIRQKEETELLGVTGTEAEEG